MRRLTVLPRCAGRGLGRRSLLISSLVAMCLAAMVTSGASAQGTSGNFPDPITTADLDRYAQRIDLSDQQRQAIVPLHDTYLMDFRALRDGPIEVYMQTYGSAGGMRFFNGPDLDAARKQVREMEDVLKKIETTDNRLFDSLTAVLTETQMERLPLVRDARARTRYQRGGANMLSMFNVGARVDLGVMYDDLDLAPDVRSATLPVIEQYERRLTSAQKKMHEISINAPVTITERLAAAGLDPSSNDRSQRRRMVEQMMELWTSLSNDLTSEASDVSELNRRTVSQLKSMLPRPAWEKLRNEFLSRAYYEVPGGWGHADRYYRRALKLDEVTGEQKSQIETERIAYHDRVDQLVGRMQDSVDKNRMTSPMRFRPSPEQEEAQAAYESKMEDYRERHGEINNQAVDTLNSILGQQFAARLKSEFESEDAEGVVAENGTFAFATVVMADGGGGAQHITVHSLDVAGNISFDGMIDPGDPYLPGPISKMDLKSYARRLALDESLVPILDTLHDDYITEFDAVKDGPVQQVLDQSESLWSMNDEGEMTGPKAGDIERLYTMRRSALEAINAADLIFFDNIGAAVLDDDGQARLERVRLARQRDVYNRGGADHGGLSMMFSGGRGGRMPARVMSVFGGSGSQEASIDVSTVVEALEQLTGEDWGRIDPELYRYEIAVTEIFRERYLAALRSQEATDKSMAASMSGSDERVVRSRAFGVGGGNEDQQAAEAARTSIIETNRATIESLRQLLNSDTAESLRIAYNRAAFPSIFDASASTTDMIDRALALTDLTADQRAAVSDLSIQFRSDDFVFCEKMVEIELTSDLTMNFRNWEKVQEKQQRTERLRFDRNELGRKTLDRLRSVLSASQVARIPGLAPEG